MPEVLTLREHLAVVGALVEGCEIPLSRREDIRQALGLWANASRAADDSYSREVYEGFALRLRNNMHRLLDVVQSFAAEMANEHECLAADGSLVASARIFADLDEALRESGAASEHPGVPFLWRAAFSASKPNLGAAPSSSASLASMAMTVIHAVVMSGGGVAIESLADSYSGAGEYLIERALGAQDYGEFYASLYFACAPLLAANWLYEVLPTAAAATSAKVTEERLARIAVSLDNAVANVDGKRFAKHHERVQAAAAARRNGGQFAATQIIEHELLYPRVVRPALLA